MKRDGVPTWLPLMVMMIVMVRVLAQADDGVVGSYPSVQEGGGMREEMARMAQAQQSLLDGQSNMHLQHMTVLPEKATELISRFGNRTIPELTLRKHAEHVGEVITEELKFGVHYSNKDREAQKAAMKKAITTSCSYIPGPAGGRKQLCCTIDSMVSCLPNFVVIGAQKSGTTPLYAYLMHHPSIRHAKDKELHFFDFPQNWNRGLHKYLTRFDHHAAREHASNFITGEASPSYMTMQGVCKRIRMTLPHTGIIAVLRDPVKRAWSEYQMGIRIDKVQNELKAQLDENMKQLRVCLEEGMFAKKAAALKNETVRETVLRQRYTAMELSDCMPKSVVVLEQWKMLLQRLIATSWRSPQWEECWKKMKEEGEDTQWAQLWEICTQGLIRHTRHEQISDATEMFNRRIEEDARKINHCAKMPEYEADFLSCNDSMFPSDLSRDYIWRGMFAKQLEECYRWFPRDQVLVLEQDELRKSPEETLRRVQEFIGVPLFNYTSISTKEAMALFNEVYPGFEATTGWKAKDGYADVPEDAKRYLVEFFDEHNQDLFKLLERSFLHWSRWDPDEYQEYYYYSSYY